MLLTHFTTKFTSHTCNLSQTIDCYDFAWLKPKTERKNVWLKSLYPLELAILDVLIQFNRAIDCNRFFRLQELSSPILKLSLIRRLLRENKSRRSLASFWQDCLWPSSGETSPADTLELVPYSIPVLVRAALLIWTAVPYLIDPINPWRTTPQSDKYLILPKTVCNSVGVDLQPI